MPARLVLLVPSVALFVGASQVSATSLSPQTTTQEAYFKASNTGPSDEFGASVALEGDVLVVGAVGESSSATGVNGNQLDNSKPDSGAAYVFLRQPPVGPWAQSAYLKASNTDALDLFGWAVALSGDTIAVGAPFEASGSAGVNGDQTDNSLPISGAVYVFVRDPGAGTWSQQAYLKASNPGGGDRFGYTLALSGDRLVVGAPFEDSASTGIGGNQGNEGAPDSGAVYVFDRDPASGTWSQSAYIKASNTGTFDGFGWSVALEADLLLVGARYEAGGGTGVNANPGRNDAPGAGAAYVFSWDDQVGAWAQEAYLKASNTGAGDHFGGDVDLSCDMAVITASGEDSQATGIGGDGSNDGALEAGAAYIYERDPTDGTWSHRAYVKASNTGAGDGFGISAALFGDTLVVGAPDEKSNATGINGNQGNNFLRNAGAAYCFRRSPQDGSWAQHAYIKASNTGHTDRFGNAVAVSGNRALVGARQEESAATGVNGSEEDNSAFQAGAAYSFLLEASQKASATVRLGSPANPNALLAGSSPGPILGSTWDPRIDHSSFFPGATTDLLLISPQGPINQPLSIGTLLCSLARPRTLLSTPAGVPFTLPIPLDCTLLGLNACAQGASLGTGMTRLTNALDIVLGAY